MRRRAFIALLGGAAAWPLAARAQQPAMPVIGFLDSRPADGMAERVRAFRQGLKDTGIVEGENVGIEYRWAENEIDRLPALAADLVRRRVAVMAVPGDPDSALASKESSTTIPIVFVVNEDQVRLGLVASLARPGGNITGFSMFEFSIIGKMLEMLKQTAPGIAGTALIYNPDNPATDLFVLPAFERAASALGVRPAGFAVHDTAEIERAIEASARLPNGSLFFPPDVTVAIHRELITTLVARHRLPAIY